eukprot:Em0532g2a
MPTLLQGNTRVSNPGVLQFPAIVRIFTPILMVELLVGLVSNILLLTLLVKARRFQNNVNVYLCSMAVNNLLCLFPVSTSLVLSVTKQWVLGQTMCTLNQAIMYLSVVPNLMLHVFISRERYRAVLHFFEWKPYSRRTHLELGVMWTLAVVMGVFGVLQGSQIIGETDDVISCYVPSRWTTEEQYLPVQITGLIIGSLIGPGSLLLCIVHYIYIFRQLHIIRKVHNSSGIMPPVLNRIDIPIQWESEVRALKSLATVFFMAVVPYIFGVNIFYAVVESIALIQQRKYSDVDSPLSLIFRLWFYFLPTSGPMVIFAVNKRFRVRIKELFKWQLKPDSANIHDVNSNTYGIVKHNSLRVAIPQHKNTSPGVFIMLEYMLSWIGDRLGNSLPCTSINPSGCASETLAGKKIPEQCKYLPLFHGCQQPAVFVPYINFTGIDCDQAVGLRTDHCTLNQAIMYMSGVPNLTLQVFISRERYRAVLHFFEWKPYSRRTHLELGVMWTVTVVTGVFGVLQGSQIIGETDDIISCYIPSRFNTEEQFLPVQITGLIMGSLFGPVSLLLCIVHYIYIFRQLHIIRKVQNSNGIMPPVLNRIEIPIQWESE